MIHLRIDCTGCIRGLWTDQLDWERLGRVDVRRASQIEFDVARQRWTVRAVSRRTWIARFVGLLTGRSQPPELFSAPTRAAALRWESWYFGPGGPGWVGLSRRHPFASKF